MKNLTNLFVLNQNKISPPYLFNNRRGIFRLKKLRIIFLTKEIHVVTPNKIEILLLT